MLDTPNLKKGILLIQLTALEKSRLDELCRGKCRRHHLVMDLSSVARNINEKLADTQRTENCQPVIMWQGKSVE